MNTPANTPADLLTTPRSRAPFAHHLLPADAQHLLRRAAATATPAHDLLARQRAVEYAIRRVRREHPDYFREDDYAY
jgi:hypothetical protein